MWKLLKIKKYLAQEFHSSLATIQKQWDSDLWLQQSVWFSKETSVFSLTSTFLFFTTYSLSYSPFSSSILSQSPLQISSSLGFSLWYSFAQLVPVPSLWFHIQQRQVVGSSELKTQCFVTHFILSQLEFKTCFPTNLSSPYLMSFFLLPELAAHSLIQDSSSFTIWSHQKTALHIEDLDLCSQFCA